MKRSMYLSAFALLVTVMVATSCSHRENTTSIGMGSRDKLEKWGKYLPVKEAPAGTPIATTQIHISNVGYGTAMAKASQALQSYKDSLGYELSTIFQIAQTESTGKSSSRPAITAMVVQGHLYYVAMLDYLNDSRAAYKQTNGLIPAVAVVDGEDETKPAWIRTRDEKGNPYKIKLRFNSQENWDPNTVPQFLRKHGYSTVLNCQIVDNPTLEMDDDWRPFVTVTYNAIDNCMTATNDSQDWAEKFIAIDMQTEDFKVYKLEDPNTEKREEDPIPEWIDQVYSPRLITEYIKRWGYNTENYAKTSTLNEFRPDHDIIDEVVDLENKNLVFCAYITSAQDDNSLIGVMLVNPRTSHATFYRTRGEHAMATKSTAANTIELATLRWGYHVEDVTLHYIYGVLTWVGELTLPFKNDDDKVIGEHYAGTVLVHANADIQPAGVVWASSKIEAFTKYEEFIALRKTERVGSNVMVDTTVVGKVSHVTPLNFSGVPSYLINLEGRDEQWEVKIPFIGDQRTEDALNLKVGDIAFLRYTDTMNRKTHLVKEIVNRSAKPEKAVEVTVTKK